MIMRIAMPHEYNLYEMNDGDTIELRAKRSSSKLGDNISILILRRWKYVK